MKRKKLVPLLAASIYSAYCTAVGGRAFNGDQLPSADEFFGDESKKNQSNAWLEAAETAIDKLHQIPRTSTQEIPNPDVISAIAGERAYQEEKWPGHEHTVPEWILILEKLIQDARRAWVTGHGDNQALHEVRQIAATAVACMEQCGAPHRGDEVTGRKYEG